MAQYKKDAVKEKIDLAALEVFADKGYVDTRIADISAYGNISVGNIYRYYKSKEEIFHHIVPDSFLDSLKEQLSKKIETSKQSSKELTEDFWLTNSEVIEFLVANRFRILIVLSNNKNTRYENAKEELIEFLISRAEAGSSKANETANTVFIIKLIYNSLMDITLKILKEKVSVSEVTECLSSINKYHLFGITRLLK